MEQLIRKSRVVGQDGTGERMANQLGTTAVADLTVTVCKFGKLSNIVEPCACDNQIAAEGHMISPEIFLLFFRSLDMVNALLYNARKHCTGIMTQHGIQLIGRKTILSQLFGIFL